MRHQPGQPAEIVGHQRDVGGLQRDVAARRAHGDAEIGPGQRGRVIDPVANHRHPAASGGQPGDPVALVLGQQFGLNLIDAELGADPLGRCPVVAGQHHDPADPGGMRRPERGAGLGTDRVTACREKAARYGTGPVRQPRPDRLARRASTRGSARSFASGRAR